MEHLRTPRSMIGAAVFALLSIGCASTDPALQAEGALQLRDQPPIPFSVAVTPITGATAANDTELALSFDHDELRDRLVANMRSLHAATSVDAVAADASLDSYDLVLRPRVLGSRLQHVGTSNAAWLSTLLWGFTWIGGLLIEDSDYLARLELEWEVVNPDGGRTVDVLASAAEDTTLAFLDRNRLLSLGTFQTLLLPPFLTADNDATTSVSLSERAAAGVTADLVRYLKSGMNGDQKDLIGDLRVDSPKNGARVRVAATRLRGRVACGAMIRRLSLWVNDAPEPLAVLEGGSLPSPSVQQFGGRFQVPLPDVEIPLRPGDNLIRVYLTFGGSADFGEVKTSRTIRLHREEQP